MENSITYYLAKSEKKHIPILIKYKLATIFEYAKDIDGDEKNKIFSYVSNEIPKLLDNYKIIMVGSDIIGCICCTNYKDGKLIDEIYLEKNFRNKGIGSSIIHYYLKENKIVYLWVYKENKKAINLYKRLGFNIFEETETRYLMKYKNLETRSASVPDVDIVELRL